MRPGVWIHASQCNTLTPPRRLTTIESRCETIDQAVVDLREVGSVRDETVKERLQSIERQLREIFRGVQLIRDKQVGCWWAVHAYGVYPTYQERTMTPRRNSWRRKPSWPS